VAHKCPVTTPLPATCRLHSGRHAAVVRSNNQRRGTDRLMLSDSDGHLSIAADRYNTHNDRCHEDRQPGCLMHEAESFSLPTPRRLPIPSPPHWSDVSDWVTARQSARIAAGAVTAMQVHSQLSNKPTASQVWDQVWDRCKAHEKSQIRYTVKTDQYRLPEYKRQHLREIKSVSQ